MQYMSKIYQSAGLPSLCSGREEWRASSALRFLVWFPPLPGWAMYGSGPPGLCLIMRGAKEAVEACSLTLSVCG